MTLLTCIQDAASQLGLRQPSAVFGSTDQTAQTLLRFAQQEGRELARYHDWNELIVEHTFTSLATQAQTGALPTDYDHFPYNVEIWDRTSNQRFAGPTPQRQWALLKTGITGGYTGWWRLIGGELNIYPVMTAGKTIGFEYVSKHWCESAGGTGQAAWAADTDVGRLDESLMTLGIVWRFRASKGFPQYAEDLVTYEREKEKAAGRNRGTGRIRPSGGGGDPDVPVFPGSVTV